jgi:hypothetical protein
VDLAVKDLRQAAAQEPSPAYYFHLAQARALARDRRAARDAYQRALDLGLKEADLHPLEREGLRKLVTELDLN